MTLRIVLVRQGEVYGPEYGHVLQSQIAEHMPTASVLTLTDQSDTPGQTRPLAHDLLGWWAKLELFAPNNRELRPFLYIDLDSFVLGDCSWLFGGSYFRMVEDFNDWVPANSCVMWIPESVDHIWSAFDSDRVAAIKRAGGAGDQKFLGQFCSHLWPPVLSGITSYKQHGKDGPHMALMQFHGRPKPHEIKTGWVADEWNCRLKTFRTSN
jgi:hypothetical protein